MSVATTEARKPLGVRVTSEQHRIITEAAKREHRSVSSFVLSAALKAAELKESYRPRYTPEEADVVIKRVQEAFRKVNPTGRSIVDELSSERREAAKLE